MKIAIVGAGIMGSMLAYFLVKAGADIVVFDQATIKKNESCSMSAAGLLAPATELERSDPLIYQLGMRSLELLPTIFSMLSSTLFFQKNGSIVIAHPQEKADLQRFISHISAKVPSVPFQKFSNHKLIEIEPALKKFEEGYFFPEEGHLDSQQLLQDLKNFLCASSVNWRENQFVKSVLPGEIQLENETLHFDLVLDCRGLGSRSRFNDLQAIRGELIWLEAPDVHITRPVRFIHPRYSLYIVPRPYHVYLVGASEIHSEDYQNISVRTALELLTAAYYVHPSFAEATILKMVTHCRPTLQNYLPKIKHQSKLIAVNGLYRHGFLIAPAIADEISQVLQKGESFIQYQMLWEKTHEHSN